MLNTSSRNKITYVKTVRKLEGYVNITCIKLLLRKHQIEANAVEMVQNVINHLVLVQLKTATSIQPIFHKK